MSRGDIGSSFDHGNAPPVAIATLILLFSPHPSPRRSLMAMFTCPVPADQTPLANFVGHSYEMYRKMYRKIWLSIHPKMYLRYFFFDTLKMRYDTFIDTEKKYRDTVSSDTFIDTTHPWSKVSMSAQIRQPHIACLT